MSRIFSIFPSVHKVFNYMCVCVFVCRRNKVLLLCSVMSGFAVPSENSSEYQTIFDTAVWCQGCINYHKQEVKQWVCQSDSSELDQLGKIFMVSTNYRA